MCYLKSEEFNEFYLEYYLTLPVYFSCGIAAEQSVCRAKKMEVFFNYGFDS